MSDKRETRKLAAIMHADVKGYSRLMGEDESFTIQALTASRKIFSEIIGKHGGRVVNAPGDSILSEFPSVVSAVHCAVEIQRQLDARNLDLPENRRMQFRIGINLGDVIQSEDAIYGDGVNIAARIEALAEPGGVSISRTVFNHVQSKLKYGYEYQGEHHVKNITNPVRVYKLLPDPKDSGKLIGESTPQLRPSKRFYIAALAILLISVAGVISHFYLRHPNIDPPKAEEIAFQLPDKPSIAVLPFVNMNEDPKQEYFSDGITHDLITALSKFGELLVIASNTIFTYKSKSVNIENVGRELGVRYILEGSIQKYSARVRVNAKLIDATTGFHIWSEKYDRDLNDIFAVQDEIVKMIIGNLAVKIDAAERKRTTHKKTENMQAYDYLLRGREHLRTKTCSEFRKARKMFEKAIEIDPESASAYVGLGRAYQGQTSYGCIEFPAQALNQAKDLVRKALNLDASNADAYALLGLVNTYSGKYDLAINQLNRAIELNPNNALALSYRGQVMLWSGRVDEGIHSLETAVRYDPYKGPGDYMFLGIGYYLKGLYDKAINVAEEGLNRKPDWAGNHVILAAAYAQSGHANDAEREAKEVLRLEPFFDVDDYGTVFRKQADRAKIVQGLRKAGLN